jgi:hypothetical protein
MAKVVRRQPDGTWAHVIDNACGDQTAAAGVQKRAFL